jgi:Flp pilus assembly secretin CpaC
MFIRSVVVTVAVALGSGAIAQTSAAPPATPPAGRSPSAITAPQPAVGPVRRELRPAGQAASAAPSEPTKAPVEPMALAVGQVQIVTAPQNITSILIGQAEIADVSTISERSFAVTAKKAGYTSMLLLNEQNQQILDIRISVVAEDMAGRRRANVIATSLGRPTYTISPRGSVTITTEEDKRLDHSYRCERIAPHSCTFDQSKSNVARAISESRPEPNQ